MQPHKVVSPLKVFFLMMVRAFKLAWKFLLSLTAVFFVTFVIFPPVIIDTNLEFLHGIQNNNLRISWTILVFIFAFNVFDTVGRWLAG